MPAQGVKGHRRIHIMNSRRLFIAAACVVGLTMVVGIFMAARGSSAHETYKHAMAGGAGGAKGRQFWHCGMHPQVIQDHPGDCPICHMALTPIGGTGGPSTMPAGERKVLY